VGISIALGVFREAKLAHNSRTVGGIVLKFEGGNWLEGRKEVSGQECGKRDLGKDEACALLKKGDTFYGEHKGEVRALALPWKKFKERKVSGKAA